MQWWKGAAALSVLMLGAMSAPALGDVKLRAGVIVSLKTPIGQSVQVMADEAAKLSNGEIKIDVFPSGQLGGETEMLSQIRLGTLDMGQIGSGIVAAMEPTFSLTELPYIWKDFQSAVKVLNSPIGDKMLALLDAKGIKGLGWTMWGPRGFLLNTDPIESPADMKGAKIRVIENPLYVKTVTALGANPVPMAWPEVYTALQQKTINGVETNYTGMRDAKQYEVATTLAVTHHIYTAGVWVMNADKFNALKPAHKEILKQAIKAGSEYTYRESDVHSEEAIKFMESKGVKVTYPKRADFEPLTASVHEAFSLQIGPQLLEEVKAAQQ